MRALAARARTRVRKSLKRISARVQVMPRADGLSLKPVAPSWAIWKGTLTLEETGAVLINFQPGNGVDFNRGMAWISTGEWRGYPLYGRDTSGLL